MNIIGGLKKSKSPSTIYFCEYRDDDFNWDDVVALLKRCPSVEFRLKKEDIYCIAVECADGENKRTPDPPDFENGVLVGIVYISKDSYISLTPEDYADIDVYLKEIAESA